jgi:hypothetical protein
MSRRKLQAACLYLARGFEIDLFGIYTQAFRDDFDDVLLPILCRHDHELVSRHITAHSPRLSPGLPALAAHTHKMPCLSSFHHHRIIRFSYFDFASLIILNFDLADIPRPSLDLAAGFLSVSLLTSYFILVQSLHLVTI